MGAHKKFLLVSLLFVVAILFLAVVFVGPQKFQSLRETSPVSEKITATPFLQTTSSPSGVIVPTGDLLPSLADTTSIPSTESSYGRLSYISGKDIYNTDLKITHLLVKNDASVVGNLKWSPKGSYLSWIEKNSEGTQSAIVLYGTDTKKTKKIPLDIPSITTYFYSPDEKQISVMYRESPHQITSLDIEANTLVLEDSFASPYPITFITWLKNGKILFGGKTVVFLYSLPDKTWTPIINQNGLDHITLSPDETKIVYSVINSDKVSWFILNLETNISTPILLTGENSDFSSVDLSSKALEKGFDSKAVWFPSSDKIFLTIKYLKDFPIVGIYDISANSFSSVSFFNIKNSDFMSDAYTLVGERSVTKNGATETQIHFFSIEGKANLGLIKVIPNSFSPAFYSGN